MIRISFNTPSISELDRIVRKVSEIFPAYFNESINPYLDKNNKDFIKIIEDKDGKQLGIVNKIEKTYILFNECGYNREELLLKIEKRL